VLRSYLSCHVYSFHLLSPLLSVRTAHSLRLGGKRGCIGTACPHMVKANPTELTGNLLAAPRLHVFPAILQPQQSGRTTPFSLAA
jgi:hypothetical protein